MPPRPSPSAGARALVGFLRAQGRRGVEMGCDLADHLEAAPEGLFDLLKEDGQIRERELAELLARHLRLQLVDLKAVPPEATVAQLVRDSVAAAHLLVPIRCTTNSIDVAMANPLDAEAIRAVEFSTGLRARPCVATVSDVHEAIAKLYRIEESLERFLQGAPDDGAISITDLSDEGLDLHSIARDSDLPPVVKLADVILLEASKNEASDIHVEPVRDGVVIRYRLDGLLEESFRFPRWVQQPLVGRFKVMARLDITERHVPQDGRLHLRHDGRMIDLRMSTLPTNLGEKIVMRLLGASQSVRPLDDLGLEPRDADVLREAVRVPEGMVLVTGPTGSGKTTTLYALLRELYSPARNIVTIENPIEYQLAGITQVQVNDKRGLGFARVLRSVLRQDPDVILVGEIRDRETAEIAFQAAQTGHLVLSTLHTNDAAGTVTRLIDLGVEPFVIASSLRIVVAQRLVRRLCRRCAEPDETPLEQLGLRPLAGVTPAPARPMGCRSCRKRGFQGRIGIYELLPIRAGVGRALETRAGETVLRARARAAGFRPLAVDAQAKALRGLTTMEEVLRVVHTDDDVLRCGRCSAEVADDYSVCPSCGNMLKPRCAGCERLLQPEWLNCPQCGRGLNAPPGRRAGGRPSCVLVVDDDVEVRNMLEHMIEHAGLGLRTVLACDAGEALKLLDVERPDIAILDLGLPDMDGFELCRRIRAAEQTTDLPVLIITGDGDAEQVARGFEAGADDYVVKPVRRAEVVARIRRMLERTYGGILGNETLDAPHDPPRSIADDGR